MANLVKTKLHEVIFGHDTFLGKAFDIGLLIAIVLSVIAVSLESVQEFNAQYNNTLFIVEWSFTILFSIEYLLRIYCAPNRLRYVGSFFGIIDLLSILPSYLSLVFKGSQYLLVIRGLRLVRIFRVLKMTRYLGEAEVLSRALKASLPKITVFLITVISLIAIIGTLIHLVEGPHNGFTSIPRGMYWAIVTLTTVGYGDIAPKTVGGQMLASIVMILGYGIIAVPTGIVSAELTKTGNLPSLLTKCPSCGHITKDENAYFCAMCGESLRKKK